MRTSRELIDSIGACKDCGSYKVLLQAFRNEIHQADLDALKNGHDAFTSQAHAVQPKVKCPCCLGEFKLEDYGIDDHEAMIVTGWFWSNACAMGIPPGYRVISDTGSKS